MIISAAYLSAMFGNLKVVELASVLAGPLTGQFFAELGALVIKIENPSTGGDVTRSWKFPGETSDDRSAYFSACNWGKKSVALDLTRREDYNMLVNILKDADLVITSYKPGDARKLRVDYETLASFNPRLIYGQITGYGSSSDRVGYDAVIQAESGFMDMNGSEGGDPIKMPVALIDVLAAHHLKEGLLLALIDRSTSGKGHLVSVSLMDAALASLVNQATNWLVGGKIPTRKGSAHPNIAPYGDCFTCADGRKILLAVGSDRQFRELLEVLGVKGSYDNPHLQKFDSNTKRVQFRKELNDLLSACITRFQSDDLFLMLKSKNIPAGIIKNMREVFEDEEAKSMLLKSSDRLAPRTFVLPGFIQKKNLTEPPTLGEHTLEFTGKQAP